MVSSNEAMNTIAPLAYPFLFSCFVGSHSLCCLFYSDLKNKDIKEKLIALALATYFNHINIIEFLLAYFDPPINLDEETPTGKSVLQIVEEQTENEEILSLFQKYKATPESLIKELQREQGFFFSFLFFSFLFFFFLLFYFFISLFLYFCFCFSFTLFFFLLITF